MIYDFKSPIDYLKNEFEQRVRKNPRYSLRAFAKMLGLHAAELSELFHGKRHLSLKSASKIKFALGLNNEETKYFFTIIENEKQKKLGIDLDFIESKNLNSAEISNEDFAKICEWYHFAILSLTETRGFQWSARTISQRLGITIAQANLAMTDLQRAGLVDLMTKNKSQIVKTTHNIPSQSIRHYHRQMLEKAIDALDSQPVHLRDFQSIGIAVDTKKIHQMKTELNHFTDRLIEKYHQSNTEQVYQLQLAFFQLTKDSKNES